MHSLGFVLVCVLFGRELVSSFFFFGFSLYVLGGGSVPLAVWSGV
jgi:hypothetical protein